MCNDFYCKQVLSGAVAVDKVIETEHVLAFHHTKPSWPVHIVVIPKFHIESLLDLIHEHSDLLTEMMDVLAGVVDKVWREHGGCRLTTNFGKLQQTKHLHWHVYVAENM
ncbi:MAG: HIT domain-containing protein [Candidatus Competibacteraceae bacterium]